MFSVIIIKWQKNENFRMEKLSADPNFGRKNFRTKKIRSFSVRKFSFLMYYNALAVSTDSDFQVHFKRQTNSCFVNNYFAEGLLAWQANIDILSVINHYKAVAYIKIRG